MTIGTLNIIVEVSLTGCLCQTYRRKMITVNSPYTTRDSFELYKGKEPKIYEHKVEKVNKIHELAKKQIEENQQQSWCVIS